jgi:methylmalonyl-CoA mutase N-terminal domain/subunit
MGYDSDSPRSLGEVGMCGVAVDTLRDMEVLFDGIPLDKVTTSMTINGPAIVLLAFYVALADKRGISRASIGGTVQNDCLKEFIAQHAWLVPPRPAMRIVTDMIEFCSREVPRWNSVSISGYHIREAGSTAAQELAFTLADGLGYVESCLERGLDVDAFAPRLSFFFDVHNDFFEEIAKFRAARRMWARFMKERYGAKKAESMKLRTHAQTAGVSLTAPAAVQQRGARLAAGPGRRARRDAVAAHQLARRDVRAAHRRGRHDRPAHAADHRPRERRREHDRPARRQLLRRVADRRLEQEALEYIRRIDEMGGMVSAIEKGYPQREIAAAAYRFQREVDAGERVMVGVNRFVQRTRRARRSRCCASTSEGARRSARTWRR